jgi:hypothetical protein
MNTPSRHARGIDETRNVYGRLTVLEYAGVVKGHTAWACLCECERVSVIHGISLRSGKTTQCNDCRVKAFVSARTKHGHFAKNSPTRYIATTWLGMRTRCKPDPSSAYYKYYAGRGIEIYPDWNNDVEAFVAYVLEHLVPRKEGESFDRINNDGNYEPGNVRWASPKAQNMNKSPANGRELKALRERVAHLEATISQAGLCA